jgi:hypothetical protein
MSLKNAWMEEAGLAGIQPTSNSWHATHMGFQGSPESPRSTQSPASKIPLAQ